MNKGPLQLTNPAWWAMVASIVLAALGVSDPNLSSAVQGVVAGAAALVVGIYTREHHKTIRNADTAAATIRAAALSGRVTARPASAAATAPAGAPAAPTANTAPPAATSL